MSKLIQTELANVACLSNYDQDSSINGFVGIISMANFMCTNFWSIKNGNKQIPNRLLKLSGANVFLNSKIKSLSAKNDDKNLLVYEKNGAEHEKIYDYIVVAFPLTLNDEFVINFNFTDHFEYQMKTTKVVFVRGELDYSNEIPLNNHLITVMSADPALDYRSIESVIPCDGTIENKNNIYKIVLTDIDSLKKIFKNYEIIQQVDWPAYPLYKILEDPQPVKKVPRQKNEPHIAKTSLYPRLIIDSQERSRIFYLNSIEWLASSMEMSCINARNIALLISNKQQSKEITLKKNGIYSTSKRRYHRDACGILSALSIFILVFALWFKEPSLVVKKPKIKF
jgi:prenylcysteine oxidase/farnesylcysteine lyase